MSSSNDSNSSPLSWNATQIYAFQAKGTQTFVTLLRHEWSSFSKVLVNVVIQTTSSGEHAHVLPDLVCSFIDCQNSRLLHDARHRRNLCLRVCDTNLTTTVMSMN